METILRLLAKWRLSAGYTEKWIINLRSPPVCQAMRREPHQRHVKEFNFCSSDNDKPGPNTSVPRRSHPVSTFAVPERHVPLRERDNSKYTGESGASRYRALAA